MPGVFSAFGRSKDDVLNYLFTSDGRVLAHQVLFPHRHTIETPRFHGDIIRTWHDVSLPFRRILTMAFREAGKSTLAEEVFIIRAWMGLFHNGIILGSTEKRACEKLRAIKYELDSNELGTQLYGDQGGKTASVWNEAEVILANGVRIIAAGRGQSLRGTKHLHYRPDFCLFDDIEDEEHVSTPEARAETYDWFRNVVMPALDRDALVRMIATPLDRDSLPMKLKPPDWLVQVFPVEYIDRAGERCPTWPAHKSLAWIDGRKAEEAKQGNLAGYMREYMCVAEDPERKVFKAAMFKVEPRVRTWQPVWAFYDPARSVRASSATTGWAVWSWIGRRLIVWDAGADMLLPDAIVAHIFEVAEKWAPVAIGVEEDGLNEFLKQPIRHEQLRRGILVPVVPMRAPRNKLGFIEALQPYFVSGEATFAKLLPELVGQFLNFPTGRIDAPNALAYAPRMRPGVVIYEDFAAQHVSQDLHLSRSAPVYLALNATLGVTTGVLVQFRNGTLQVFADFVMEGDPGAVLERMVGEARLEAQGGELRLVGGLRHFADYNPVGLLGSVAKLPATLLRGGAENVGRGEIRGLLSQSIRGEPAVQVAPRARWTLNAFCAGYALDIDNKGIERSEARDGVYRVLMEGLEAFASLLNTSMMEDRGTVNIQRTPSGQKWISALPNRQEVVDAKSDWGIDVNRVLAGQHRR